MVAMNQLRWRCRRGTQELDLLLLSYLERFYLESTPKQQQCFHEFLELEDNHLQHYLLGNVVATDSELAELVDKILSVKPVAAADANL